MAVVKRTARKRIQTNAKHSAVETSTIPGDGKYQVLSSIPEEPASAFYRRVTCDSGVTSVSHYRQMLYHYIITNNRAPISTNLQMIIIIHDVHEMNA
jgi:hypothetical protein